MRLHRSARLQFYFYLSCPCYFISFSLCVFLSLFLSIGEFSIHFIWCLWLSDSFALFRKTNMHIAGYRPRVFSRCTHKHTIQYTFSANRFFQRFEREKESSTTVFRYILLCARIQTFQWSSLCCSSGGVSCTKPTEIIHFAFFWRFDLRTELKSRLFLDYLLFFCQTDRDRWEFILMIWNHCGFVPHKEERWIVK